VSERERYQRYLASREWAVLKEQVRARSGGVCERCKKAPYEQTHHVTYARKYHERIDDLQAVCELCHLFVSGKSDLDPAAQRKIIVCLDETTSYNVDQRRLDALRLILERYSGECPTIIRLYALNGDTINLSAPPTSGAADCVEAVREVLRLQVHMCPDDVCEYVRDRSNPPLTVPTFSNAVPAAVQNRENITGTSVEEIARMLGSRRT